MYLASYLQMGDGMYELHQIIPEKYGKKLEQFIDKNVKGVFVKRFLTLDGIPPVLELCKDCHIPLACLGMEHENPYLICPSCKKTESLVSPMPKE